MNRQKFFAELMATLIGKPIDLDEKISLSRRELETSCEKLSAEINNTKFKIDIENCYEPCPFLCNNFDRPFDFVFVGLNPGGALNPWEKFSWERTTWHDLANFCVPNDIRADEHNGYRFLSKSVAKIPYYQFFLRLHVALTGGEIFDTWGDLQKRHADTEKFFVEHIAAHSILNTELVPYKSDGISFTAKNLVNDATYGKYFRRLVDFIETESATDAWIVFYGATSQVKKLFGKFAPHWKVPSQNLYLKVDGYNRGNRFHIFKRGRRKILLSPFLSAKYRSPLFNRLGILIDALKESPHGN